MVQQKSASQATERHAGVLTKDPNTSRYFQGEAFFEVIEETAMARQTAREKASGEREDKMKT